MLIRLTDDHYVAAKDVRMLLYAPKSREILVYFFHSGAPSSAVLLKGQSISDFNAIIKGINYALQLGGAE